jgi:hypothetical protein
MLRVIGVGMVNSIAVKKLVLLTPIRLMVRVGPSAMIIPKIVNRKIKC